MGYICQHDPYINISDFLHYEKDDLEIGYIRATASF